ncbi:hypothetical protein FRC02_003102 [Tulasnella sp. 418]|nr:hypothetical protein FRC02_003102 [Tulasnella sp. 418]
MVSFAHSLRKHWGPFEANILGVKKQQDDLDTELVTLEKELEILESQPSTSSPSTRSFIGAIASSFTWTNSRPRSPAEISDRIKAIMSEKELLDKHPGYEEARVRLDAIATVKKDVDRVIDVLESVWKPAVDDCRSIREIFERISLIRSPELIRRELRSVNTIYDLLADSLDAYTIGMKDVEEQLQRLM